MKKLLPILIAIAGILCFVLCYLGSYYDMQILIYLGLAAIFGTLFLILTIGVTVGFARSYKHKDDLEDWSNPKTAFTVEDRYAVAEYVFGRSLFGFRMAPKKAKILSYLLLLFVILNFFCGILFLFMQLEIPATVCLFCFGVTFFVCLLAAVIRFIVSISTAIQKERREEAETEREHNEILKKFERGEYEYKIATVLNCTALPSSQDGKEWYEFLLEIDGKRFTANQTYYFGIGTHVVTYSIADVILINIPKSKELQQREQEESTK